MVLPVGVHLCMQNGCKYKPVLLKSQVIKSLIQFDNYSYQDANDFWNKHMMMDDSKIIAVDDMLSQEEINKLIF